MSISNRILLLSALACGTTEVKSLFASDDTHVMLEALRALGVNWTRHEGTDDYRVEGIGRAFPVKQAELFLGNAGTAFRSLTAACALAGGDYVLKGVPRMHERPIGDLVDALRQLGAQVSYLGVDGEAESYAPVTLEQLAHPGRFGLSGGQRVKVPAYFWEYLTYDPAMVRNYLNLAAQPRSWGKLRWFSVYEKPQMHGFFDLLALDREQEAAYHLKRLDRVLIYGELAKMGGDLLYLRASAGQPGGGRGEG